jgi:hypothetical protein
MSPRLARHVLLCLGVLSGCSADREANDLAGGQDGDEVGDTADSGGDLAPLADVVWWRLDADFVVAAGLPTVDGEGDEASILSVTVLDEDLVEVCTATAPLSSAASTQEVAFDGLVDAWSLEAGTWVPACKDARWDDWFSPLEAEFVLAFGALHPEVEAALGGLSGIGDGAASSLNGAYLQTAEVDLVAIGAAGPAAAYQGDGLPLDAAPVGDGEWYMRGVFGLAL